MGTTTPGDETYLAACRADLLRFMVGAVRPEGFGWLDERGAVDLARPVELWITCRMTHVAALGALAGEPPAPGGPDGAALRGLVDHGVAALRGPLHDDEHGGWFAAVGPDGPEVAVKQAYGHAFVVLAASSAVVAGAAGADALLAEALEVASTRFWDEQAGSVGRGVGPGLDGAWTPTAGSTRTCTPSRRTWPPGTSPATRCGTSGPGGSPRTWSPGRAATTGASRSTSTRTGPRCSTTTATSRRTRSGRTARRWGTGWSGRRLLLAVDASLPGRVEGLGEAAAALYDRAVADGWAADGADGFVYTTDWDGTPVVRERMHWVLAEAVNTAVALHRITGDRRYADDAARWWAYAEEYLIDHEHGSWHHELDPQNRPAGTVWPGKPDVYHAYQAALLPTVPLVPSFAVALARRA